MTVVGTERRKRAGKSLLYSPSGYGQGSPPCPKSSDVDLLSYGDGIVDLDAEITDGAFDFRMTEK